MAITPWYDVWCDADGCILWTHGGSTRADAAKEARRVGWKRIGSRWFCPADAARSALAATESTFSPVQR